MKHYIGIFAHPDDEAYGPGGSFITWGKHGAQTHVLTATKGELGGDSGIEDAREQEMNASAQLLGLASHHFLGFHDGELRNAIYSEIREAVIEKLSSIISEGDDVTFITFERAGVSGHLDHIAMSMITSHIYMHREEWLPKMSSCELLYFCRPRSERPKARTGYFVFTAAGVPDERITVSNDVSGVLEQKKQAIRTHASQRPEQFMKMVGDKALATEHFAACDDID